jgi:DNA-binding transcriptional MerR regulator
LTTSKKADRLAISLKEDRFMSDRLYTQREVSDIFYDVPNKTLIYWARQGLVEWVAETRDARGIARLYSYWNLFQIGLVRELAGIGLSIEIIRDIMDRMFKDYPQKRSAVINDEGEEVEEGLPSEFFYSGDIPTYFVILKGALARGIEQSKIELMALSNLTKDDPFQLNLLSPKKKKKDMPKGFGKKIFDEIITTFIIIDLSAIKGSLDDLIEHASLD